MKIQKAMRRITQAFRDDKRHVVIVMSDGRAIRGLLVDSEAVSEPIGVPGEMVAGPIKVTLKIEVLP